MVLAGDRDFDDHRRGIETIALELGLVANTDWNKTRMQVRQRMHQLVDLNGAARAIYRATTRRRRRPVPVITGMVAMQDFDAREGLGRQIIVEKLHRRPGDDLRGASRAAATKLTPPIADQHRQD